MLRVCREVRPSLRDDKLALPCLPAAMLSLLERGNEKTGVKWIIDGGAALDPDHVKTNLHFHIHLVA